MPCRSRCAPGPPASAPKRARRGKTRPAPNAPTRFTKGGAFQIPCPRKTRRLRPSCWTHLDRHCRELSAGGWLHHHSASFAVLHGGRPNPGALDNVWLTGYKTVCILYKIQVLVQISPPKDLSRPFPPRQPNSFKVNVLIDIAFPC